MLIVYIVHIYNKRKAKMSICSIFCVEVGEKICYKCISSENDISKSVEDKLLVNEDALQEG